MQKAVIFDLDGTLIDSLPDIADHVNIMLNKFNYPQLEQARIMQYIGNGAKMLVKNCIGVSITDEQLEERLAFYNESYTASGSPKTGLFDGISELLVELKRRGYKLAILTNKPQTTTNDIAKRYLNDFGFDKILGQSKDVKCKPDKTATISMLNELGVLPENAYFVGDGETDVLTAINSGTNGIAVLWGYRSKEQLASVGAQVFASEPKDILNLIK